jgi:ribosome-associated protein
VNAIEGSIKKTITQDIGEKPWHVEGDNVGEWILMDYSDIVVHIFQDKIRQFYNIEGFWGDAKFVNYKAS